MLQKNPKKSPKLYECLSCNYNTSNKKDYDKHQLTRKHLNTTKYNIIEIKTIRCSCGKEYKHRSSLYNHKKICNNGIPIKIIKEKEKEKEKEISIEDQVDYKTMVFQLIKENSEIKNLMIEQQNQINILIPKVGNNNNNNNIKQKFNIQIFLNDKCKNALSIDEFIDKIEISMKNLLTTKDLGLGAGLSNIIIDNMNKLSLYERPMHCTDKKRETLYIKNNEWEKDTDSHQITRLLNKVENKQIKSIKKWTDDHPNFLEDEKLQTEYMNLIRGCTSSIEACKEKTIKNLCENVYITK